MFFLYTQLAKVKRIKFEDDLHFIMFIRLLFFLCYWFFFFVSRLSLYKTICRSRLSPSFLSPSHLLTTTKLHLFAKCFYLHSNRREKLSIDMHARKWCRRAASSPRLRLPIAVFIWSFNFMQWKDIRKKKWLIDFRLYEYIYRYICIRRVARCVYLSSSANKYWMKTLTKTRE
jgi:hypothetical protein